MSSQNFSQFMTTFGNIPFNFRGNIPFNFGGNIPLNVTHLQLSNIHPKADEYIFKPDDDWFNNPYVQTWRSDRSVTFEEKCIGKYYATKDNFEWFHIVIHGLYYEKFLNIMETYDEKKTVILPLFCWDQLEDKEKAHRHMIVVSPRNHFILNVWDRYNSEFLKNFYMLDQPRYFYIFKAKDLINIINDIKYMKMKCTGKIQHAKSETKQVEKEKKQVIEEELEKSNRTYNIISDLIRELTEMPEEK